MMMQTQSLLPAPVWNMVAANSATVILLICLNVRRRNRNYIRCHCGSLHPARPQYMNALDYFLLYCKKEEKVMDL